MIWSYSGLSSTEGKYGCWAKIYFHYILKLQGDSSFALDFGKAAHAVIETMIKTRNFEIADILCETIASANDFSEDQLKELKDCVKTFMVQEAVKAGGIVEEYFEYDLEDSPFSPVLRGYIDHHVVGDGIVLTDWKTNQAIYDPTDTYQLALYAAYLKQKYNLPVLGRLVFLRHHRTLTHEYTDADIKEAKEWALETALKCEARAQKIEMGCDPFEAFPKQPGPCNYCGYASICLKDTSDAPEFITTKEEAIQTAQFIQLNKEITKAAEDRLKTFINATGPVENEILKAQMSKSEYMVFDLTTRKAVVEKMTQQGINIGSVLKIGSDAQKDLIQKHSWKEQDFINLGAKKRSKTTLAIEKIEKVG